MPESENRGTSKVYCESCDRVFDSRRQYEMHFGDSSYTSGRCGKSRNDGDAGGVSCDSCPLDTALSKLLGLFRRK